MGDLFDLHIIYYNGFETHFHLWMYRIYTTPCIYLLKNINRTLLFKKKIRFDFITGIFSFPEPSL